MKKIQIGEKLRGKEILDIIHLSDGWIIIKTENSKSVDDFKVKTIYLYFTRKLKLFIFKSLRRTK